MLKAEELAIIDEAISKLGRESYLGPWLASVRPELADSIKSDYFPSPMLPNEAHRDAAGILARANEAADAVAESADRKARATIDAAQKEADGIRARLIGDLRGMSKRLGGEW